MTLETLMEETLPDNTASWDRSKYAGQYLTLLLGNVTYGLPIREVREIIGIQPITRIPDTASCIKGVMNLRGQVVPIFDLRLKLGQEELEYREETCIIVVESGESMVGMIVDAVSEVVNLEADCIEPAPRFDNNDGSECLTAVGRANNMLVMLLNTELVSRIR
jgi:purine-binding chemotaxis protein CheW